MKRWALGMINAAVHATAKGFRRYSGDITTAYRTTDGTRGGHSPRDGRFADQCHTGRLSIRQLRVSSGHPIGVGTRV